MNRPASKRKTRLTTIGVTLTLVLGSTAGPSHAAASSYPKTLAFLNGMFVSGKYVEGFTPGKPDFGFTLEAMLQRLGGGMSSARQSAAIKTTILDNTNIGTSQNRHGYLFDTNGDLKLGAAGKYLFAAAVFKAGNNQNRLGILGLAKTEINPDGALRNADGNAFDYSWLTLGLASNGDLSAACRVSTALARLPRQDGGWGYDTTNSTSESQTDSTGIALQALGATSGTCSKSQEATKYSAIRAAIKYLKQTQIAGNHWEAWGDFDTNGTAYAAMGLRAVRQPISAISAWLASKIAPDGGLRSAWSNGAGDTYATAQSYVALRGLSYLNLAGLNH
ncbi:MAG: hypothetical protein RLZZ626_478 [Actinomycetota bacterium]